MQFPGNIPHILRACVFAVLVGPIASAQSPAHGPSTTVHVLEGFGKGTIPLEGAWQFHLGDNPGWAAPDFNDAGWEQLTADKQWGLQGHPAVIGFGWYRYQLTVRPTRALLTRSRF